MGIYIEDGSLGATETNWVTYYIQDDITGDVYATNWDTIEESLTIEIVLMPEDNPSLTDGVTQEIVFLGVSKGSLYTTSSASSVDDGNVFACMCRMLENIHNELKNGSSGGSSGGFLAVTS